MADPARSYASALQRGLPPYYPFETMYHLKKVRAGKGGYWNVVVRQYQLASAQPCGGHRYTRTFPVRVQQAVGWGETTHAWYFAAAAVRLQTRITPGVGGQWSHSSRKESGNVWSPHR